jgi:alkylmercury lyase
VNEIEGKAGGVDVGELLSPLSASFRPSGLSSNARTVLVHAARLLTGGRPVTAAEIAAASGLSLSQTREELSGLASFGLALLDSDGLLEGAIGLSLTQTRHRFRIHEQELYTWCAFDALFLPAVLNRRAIVESRCPVAGRSLKLVVSPESIESVDPATIFLSFVIPGSTPSAPDCCCPTEGAQDAESARRSVAGPEGSFCSQVHFFVSEEAGSEWMAEHPGASLLPPHTAFRIGREALARPLLDAVTPGNPLP